MAVNLVHYENWLEDLEANWLKQITLLRRYKKSLHTFNDNTTVEWTQSQKLKALNDARANVTELETIIVIALKTALNM